MSKRTLRNFTKPVRDTGTGSYRFFSHDLPLFFRSKMPFLRHARSKLKPREGTTLYVLSTFVLAILLIITLIQISFFTVTLTNISKERNTIKELRAKLDGDMTPYHVDYAATTLKELFSASQLTLITQKYYSYEVLINGQPVTAANFTVPKGVLTLEVAEVLSSSNLPAAILAIGSVTGGDTGTKLGTYIAVQNNTGTYTQDYFATMKQQDNKTLASYQIADLQAGNVITITFKDNLAKQLDFATLVLTVE